MEHRGRDMTYREPAYWEPSDDEVAFTALVLELIGRYGACSPYTFYRGVYKAVDCGPSIGMQIDAEWVYCSGLPHNTPPGWWGEHAICAISVSSIVEGSDAEVPAIVIRAGEVTSIDELAKRFDEIVTEVDSEACALWLRDNSFHIEIHAPSKDVVYAELKMFDDEMEFHLPKRAMKIPKEIKDEIVDTLLQHHDLCHNMDSEMFYLTRSKGYSFRTLEVMY